MQDKHGFEVFLRALLRVKTYRIRGKLVGELKNLCAGDQVMLSLSHPLRHDNKDFLKIGHTTFSPRDRRDTRSSQSRPCAMRSLPNERRLRPWERKNHPKRRESNHQHVLYGYMLLSRHRKKHGV